MDSNLHYYHFPIIVFYPNKLKLILLIFLFSIVYKNISRFKVYFFRFQKENSNFANSFCMQ